MTSDFTNNRLYSESNSDRAKCLKPSILKVVLPGWTLTLVIAVLLPGLTNWMPVHANLASPSSATDTNAKTPTTPDSATSHIDSTSKEESVSENELALTQSHRGENATVTVYVDKPVMGVAEYLRYTLTVIADNEASLQFEAVGDTLGSFRVIEYNPFGPIKMENGKLRWQREYILAAENSGELEIPSLAVSFFPPVADCLTADACEMTAHGRRISNRNPTVPLYELETDLVKIEVQTILTADSDLTKPRDVQPPVILAGVSSGKGSPLNLLAVALLVTLVLLTAWYHLRRRNLSTSVAQPPATGYSPRETALAALAQLRKAELTTSGNHEAYHVRLNNILRRYVADAFNIQTLERTSEEINTSVKQNPHLQQQRNTIARLLNLSDLAKFAHSYTKSEDHQLIDQVVEVIDQTSTEQDSATG